MMSVDSVTAGVFTPQSTNLDNNQTGYMDMDQVSVSREVARDNTKPLWAYTGAKRSNLLRI